MQYIYKPISPKRRYVSKKPRQLEGKKREEHEKRGGIRRNLTVKWRELGLSLLLLALAETSSPFRENRTYEADGSHEQ